MSMRFNEVISERVFGIDSDKTLQGFRWSKSFFQDDCLRPIPLPAELPVINPDHVFDRELFNRMKLWWEWDETDAPLFISGPSGCGKTSTVLQFMARVCMPVVNFTCRQSMDYSDLIGRWSSEDGRFVWVDGPLTCAWKHGCVLLINEFSLAPAPVWVALNELFEGASLRLDSIGRTVPRHANTRVVITDNCRALDVSDTYVGRKRQDVTSADRFWHVEAHWPDAKLEAGLIANRMRRILIEKGLSTKGFDIEAFAKASVSFARITREVGKSGRRMKGAPPAVSTRVLIRFAQIASVLLMTPDFPTEMVLTESLRLAIAGGLNPDKEVILLDLIHEEFAGLTVK